MLQAELAYVDVDIIIADKFLFEDVLEKEEYDTHHAPLIRLIVVTYEAKLFNAFANEQLREFFRELNMLTQAIKHFFYKRKLHLTQRVEVFSDICFACHSQKKFPQNKHCFQRDRSAWQASFRYLN